MDLYKIKKSLACFITQNYFYFKEVRMKAKYTAAYVHVNQSCA